MNGFINLDKPSNISSARAVDRVKRLLPQKTRIGHAGTLDPFATGVLVLLVGKATRQCERLMDTHKQYEATIKLGFTTATDDPESPEQTYVGTDALTAPLPTASPPIGTPPRGAPPREAIDALLSQFIGAIQQRPPAFSAMKIAGRRAYELARGGEAVVLQPRTVHVYGIELLDYIWPLLRLRIDCGRGTYIRAIARDLGEALNVGGYLTQLRRTRVGPFTIDRAVTLDLLTPDCVNQHLIPVEQVI